MKSILILLLTVAVAGCNFTFNGTPKTGAAATENAVAEAQAKPAMPVESVNHQPAETAERQAPHLTTAFEGQTRAPRPAESAPWSLETVAVGLEHPWAIEFLPDGSMLVSERPGRLRHVSADGELSAPIDGLPTIDARSQGGLLDVVIGPDFADTRLIYFTFSEPEEEDRNTTAVARARLSENRDRLDDVEVIFRQYPPLPSTGHFGSRIVFENDSTLWVALGDRQGHPHRQLAQDPTNLIGAVARIHVDGSIPTDNPFVDHEENAPELWSWGHRNIQAAALDPHSGALWTIEHGPRGGDELNLTEAGKNYGWPTISYGIEYRGGDVYEARTAAEGMQQPVYFWDPVIAPSGMLIYSGEAFPAWQNNLFVGGLLTERVSRLVMDDDRVIAEEWLPIGQRVRDLAQGPDGAIYVITDEGDGQVLRIVPDEG